MIVIVDFMNDWKRLVVNEIASLGYAVDHSEDLNLLSYKFFNLRKRRIAAIPRNIFESKNFSCPKNLTNGYDVLKNKLTKGHDVCAHLSKYLLQGDYEDLLLNDWGIHHFHLGKNPEKSGFIERTGALLFAHITVDSVYCLGIYPHGSWTQQELIRVFHDNWQGIISERKLNGILGSSNVLTDKDVAQLRKKGVQTMVQISPEIVYAPLGGGYSTAGTSMESTMRANSYMRLIRNLEDHVKENVKIFIDKIQELGYSHGNIPSFSMMIDEKGFFAVETNSGVAFLLHDHTATN